MESSDDLHLRIPEGTYVSLLFGLVLFSVGIQTQRFFYAIAIAIISSALMLCSLPTLYARLHIEIHATR